MRISDWSSDVCSSDLVRWGDATMTSGPYIALLWRGQAAEWTHRFHEARQWPIMQALRALGATARPVLYRDEAVRAIRDELLSCDAVLVWVNPLEISGDRPQPHPMLREVAEMGRPAWR